MSEQQNPVDFSFTVAGVDTAFPSAAVGEYRVSFDAFKVKPTKNPGEFQFRIECSTQEPITDTKQKEHGPGFKLGFNLTTPVGGDNDEIRLKMMARFIDALYGPQEDITNRPPFSGATLNAKVGTQFIAVVKPSKDTTYGDTEVKDFKHIPQAAA